MVKYIVQLRGIVMFLWIFSMEQ